MLQRILEAEVMDTAEEAHDYDAMDHAHVNRVFVTDLIQLRAEFGLILDVGSGTAQIPIELCRQNATAQIIAIDMSAEMLRVGRANVERSRLTNRVQLQHCDAKRMPFADAAFDVVISNSIVHHIPEPFAVFAEMVRVVKPGGLLFVRDLLRPDSLALLDSFVQKYAGDANAHQQRMFAESLHAALTLEDVRAIVSRLGFADATVQATSDRHWTFAAISPLFPQERGRG